LVDLTLFKQYLKLANELVDAAGKEELAECARLLAMNLAHYELKYGPLPLDETLDAIYADEPNEAQVELLNKGMENMVGVLGGVIQGFEQKPSH
jgi:hypothetical protein